ncbi:serine threonine-protein kinase [Orobanche hederae]
MSTAAETIALRASFKQEAAVWHKLDHPNVTRVICRCFDGDFTVKNPFQKPFGGVYHSPFEGVLRPCGISSSLRRTFCTRIGRRSSLSKSSSNLLWIYLELSYLHWKKIVHRDVKAENMLLDSNRTLKIADFRVARVEAQIPRDMAGETGTLVIWRPRYVLDGKPYNRKCDVYSFGICVWEIHCCDLPYTDLSFAEVSSAVVRQDCS